MLSEQRIGRALGLAERIVFVDEGRIVLDAPREDAEAWLAATRPAYVGRPARRPAHEHARAGGNMCSTSTA